MAEQQSVKDCDQAPDARWYQNTGHDHTRTFGVVPRFKGKRCATGFSHQTFSINYFAKRVRRHAQEAGMQRDEIARLTRGGSPSGCSGTRGNGSRRRPRRRSSVNG